MLPVNIFTSETNLIIWSFLRTENNPGQFSKSWNDFLIITAKGAQLVYNVRNFKYICPTFSCLAFKHYIMFKNNGFYKHAMTLQ